MAATGGFADAKYGSKVKNSAKGTPETRNEGFGGGGFADAKYGSKGKLGGGTPSKGGFSAKHVSTPGTPLN